MKRVRVVILPLLAVLALSGARAQNATTPPSVTRFQAQIDEYLKQDGQVRRAPGVIVFVGSSILRQWGNLEEQMAPLPAMNRGFGGSTTPEVFYYMDKIVLPYQPRFVVYYCGSNDINAGTSAQTIASNVRQFHKRLQEALPASRMFFVSVIRAPQKRAKWAAVDSVNAEIKRYAATAQQFEYIDVNPVLLDAKGQVKPGLYIADSLHYNPAAYDLFTSVIKPVLQRAWTAR